MILAWLAAVLVYLLAGVWVLRWLWRWSDGPNRDSLEEQTVVNLVVWPALGALFLPGIWRAHRPAGRRTLGEWIVGKPKREVP